MHVLVVEDQQKVAESIKKGLEENGYKVSLAADGLIGRQMALGQKFDVIILDVMLPGLNGLEVCKDIRRENTKVPILMLTALGSLDDKITGLEIGADDYLVKPFQFAELQARIKALTRRNDESVKPATLRLADLELDTESKIVKRAGNIVKLTAREFNLLELMMRNVDKVLDRDYLADTAWSHLYDVGSNVIDVYVNYLRNKVDKGYTPRLIHTVVGMGYVMRIEEPGA